VLVPEEERIVRECEETLKQRRGQTLISTQNGKMLFSAFGSS
jgi:hypothetical protein